MSEKRSEAVKHELTIQQAANVLNVPEQFLVQLVADGILTARNVDGHPRLKADDVLAYKARRQAERLEKLNELTRMSEEMGGYFDGDSS